MDDHLQITVLRMLSISILPLEFFEIGYFWPQNLYFWTKTFQEEDNFLKAKISGG